MATSVATGALPPRAAVAISGAIFSVGVLASSMGGQGDDGPPARTGIVPQFH
jgi:hypothetical protein